MTRSNPKKDEPYLSISGGTPFSPEAFCNIMRHLAGAVCIVSTSGPTGKHGLAATAVCSVCAEPPTLLAIVNRTSRTHSHIRKNETFSVNFLSEQQADVAKLMASKSDNQFAELPHKLVDGEGVLIEDTLAHLHCRVVAEHDVATHTIFIGRVLGGNIGTGSPLIYYKANFRTLRAT